MRWVLLLAMLATGACGGDDETVPVTGTGGAGGTGVGGVGGSGGEGLSGACYPGEAPTSDGDCEPAGQGAGIRPEQCAAGFETDGAEGCVPTLPVAPCPDGEVALLGETECRPLVDCGTGTWGDIPTDATTIYVDGAYSGGQSDGSLAHPWTSIQQAINWAEDGVLIAVAEGTYSSANTIGRSLRIWGRCPELVEVAEPIAAAVVISGASSELHNLAVTGASNGVLVLADQALVEGVWVHDTTHAGIFVVSPGVATVRGSLVERASAVGIAATGASVTVESTVVRDTQPDSVQTGGRGLSIQNQDDERGVAVVRSSIIDGNREVGIYGQAADLSIEATLVRDTQPDAAGQSGMGVYLQNDDSSGARASLVLGESVLVGNHSVGLVVFGSDAVVHTTVIRDTQAEPAGQLAGRGVLVADDSAAGQQPLASIEASLLDLNTDVGAVVFGGELIVESSVIRDTQPRPADQRHGRGLVVEPAAGAIDGASAVVRSSVVEGSHETGVFVAGGQLLLEASIVRDTAAQQSDQMFGRGLVVQYGASGPSVATVRTSVVEESVEGGVFVAGSELELEGSVVRNTASAATGFFGWGVAAQTDQSSGATDVTVRWCLIEGSHGAGIGAIMATVTIEDCVVRETAPNAGDILGDGIMLLSDFVQANATVVGTRVGNSVRAGIASFGGQVTIMSTGLDCNTIDLNGEPFGDFGYAFEDLGGNECRCGGQMESCAVQSTHLIPPEPLP